MTHANSSSTRSSSIRHERCARRIFYIAVIVLSALTSPLLFAEDTLSSLDNAADRVEESAETVKKLLNDPNLELLEVLSSMKDKSAVAKNWYLSVAQAVADRSPERSRKQLEQFLPRLSEDSDARYWAFSFVTRNKPELRTQLLESMLADPCLELRYDAVELQLSRLEDTELDGEQLVARYQELLAAARLPDQIQSIAEKLKELGQEVDLLSQFGFVPSWQVVGPFDNSEQDGFEQAYAPEADFSAGKLSASLDNPQYEGKSAETKWTLVTTDSPDGSIDLKSTFSEEKGAVAYAFTTFNSPQSTECEVRIGSPNAVKVWVNDELVIERKVYHSGSQIDQYSATVSLKAGPNRILVKSCQNEQSEPWAQDWHFQLRFTDSSGLAVQPAK